MKQNTAGILYFAWQHGSAIILPAIAHPLTQTPVSGLFSLLLVFRKKHHAVVVCCVMASQLSKTPTTNPRSPEYLPQKIRQSLY
jgi:hypothetical protein